MRKPEVHPAFKSVYDQLTYDIGALMRSQGTGSVPLEMELWLFIASPNAVTPFHFDRFSNFLFQFRGSKQLAVFEPWNDEVLDAGCYEAYVAREERRMVWHPDKDRFAHKFNLVPGDGVHIPFLGGHYLKNGPEDASITLSVFFHNAETRRWSRALRTNQILRKRLGRFGVKPDNVNSDASFDQFKAASYPLVWRLNRALELVERGLGSAAAG